MTTGYGLEKAVDIPFQEAVTKVTQALQQEGFGMLSDIDVAAALKKKMGKDLHPIASLAHAIHRSPNVRWD